eukprot:1155218-Pelagomonas_calceolata.AAC.1
MSMLNDTELLPEGTSVSRYGCHGEEIEISSSSCLMLGVGEYAVVRQNLEVAGVASGFWYVSHEKLKPGFVGIT